jgi:hypothetical protein
MGWLDALLTTGLEAWSSAKRHLPPCSHCADAAVFRCANCGAFVCHLHCFAGVSPIRAVCHRCMAAAFPWARDGSGGDWPYAESPWDVLGVPPDSSPEVIKQAYRAAAQRCHPDHGGTADEMAKVNAAYREVTR